MQPKSLGTLRLADCDPLVRDSVVSPMLRDHLDFVEDEVFFPETILNSRPLLGVAVGPGSLDAGKPAVAFQSGSGVGHRF